MSNVSERQAANFNELLRTLHELRTDDFRALSICFARAAHSTDATARRNHLTCCHMAWVSLRQLARYTAQTIYKVHQQ